ncbi:hypothetical protein CEXT_786711 [Caerostris extrusa]|uniref:Uncharacterized protein n=1 Tax=Caerostris extrusa TaxID=172846 RepID=A0AAV4M9F7_CAEEX|nr:hypothetical protein CEXT_786711 [Caerostris extrusa]
MIKKTVYLRKFKVTVKYIYPLNYIKKRNPTQKFSQSSDLFEMSIRILKSSINVLQHLPAKVDRPQYEFEMRVSDIKKKNVEMNLQVAEARFKTFEDSSKRRCID